MLAKYSFDFVEKKKNQSLESFQPKCFVATNIKGLNETYPFKLAGFSVSRASWPGRARGSWPQLFRNRQIFGNFDMIYDMI